MVDGAIPVYLGDGGYGRKFIYLREFWDQVIGVDRGIRARIEYIDLRYRGQIIVKEKN
jgi:hypothetical protein